MNLNSLGRLALIAALALGCTLFAQGPQTQSKTVSGKRGGTATGTATVGPHSASGNGTATGAKGKTASASGSATYGAGHATGQGEVTGPKGGVTTASGSATKKGNTTSYGGTATGPQGKTVSGSGTATNNGDGTTTTTDTVTAPNGQSKTGTKTFRRVRQPQ